MRYGRVIRSLFMAVLASVSLTACFDYENHPEVCNYKVQLRYNYNRENTSGGKNMIDYYIYSIDQYIFDEAGMLFTHDRFTPESCREMMNSEFDLDRKSTRLNSSH